MDVLEKVLGDGVEGRQRRVSELVISRHSAFRCGCGGYRGCKGLGQAKSKMGSVRLAVYINWATEPSTLTRRMSLWTRVSLLKDSLRRAVFSSGTCGPGESLAAPLLATVLGANTGQGFSAFSAVRETRWTGNENGFHLGWTTDRRGWTE